MALAVRSTATTTNNSMDGTEPAGAASGDLIVMTFYTAFSSAALTPPTGWTEILDVDGGNAFNQMGAFWIIRGASAPSYTIGGGGGTSSGIHTFAITGHDTTTPIDSTVTSATKTGTNPDSPSNTATVADTLAIIQTGNDATTGTITVPTGFTGTTTTSGTKGAYKAITASGATGVFSWTSSTNTDWGSMTILIRPAGGATTTRGRAFGQRGNAFNGGRTLFGIIDGIKHLPKKMRRTASGLYVPAYA